MEKLNISSLKTPLDIPVGTLLVQHWLNSSSIYQIVSTTKKSVVVVEVPTKQTHFDHDGGGTGTSYKVPDLNWLEELRNMYESYGKKFNDADFWEDMDKAVILSNNRSSLIPKRIMVKPAKNGGFYIPGVQRGSWCGNMNLYSGGEVSDYYGD